MLFIYNSSASLRASIRSPLLPSFSRAAFRGLHTTTSVTCDFSRSYNQAAQVPSSNVTRKSPRSPSMNCRIVSMTHSITTLPTELITAIEILCLCTSMPIHLVLVIKGVLSGGVEPSTQNLLQRGALFIMRGSHYLMFQFCGR